MAPRSLKPEIQSGDVAERDVLMEESYRILIVGGGIIGSSIAMSLVEMGVRDVAVVDCDLSGKWSSSERNAGGVRATWAQQVNTDLSKASISFYESVASEVGFQQKGYLWLYDETVWKRTAHRRADQIRWGCRMNVLSPAEITLRFPFLDRLGGVYAATHSPDEGLINPNLLKKYYRERASQDKAGWIDRHVVEKVELVEDVAHTVFLREMPSEDEVKGYLVDQKSPMAGKRRRVRIETLVNAAGSWAPPLARLYGRVIPSVPIRRQVSIMHSQEVDLAPYGMIVDTSGLYFHHEAGNILAGYAVPNETPGFCFDYEGDSFFMQEIWPRLSGRGSHFERLKQIGGWAGLYAVSPDNSAIVGRVHGTTNIFEAHSFSGHGVMHSYAVGRALAELIVNGAYGEIDLSLLSGDRFEKDSKVSEAMWI
ncbi:MAG: NAD(P)/FAD-dependent oxidoreductase [Nitrospiria bacterium]